MFKNYILITIMSLLLNMTVFGGWSHTDFNSPEAGVKFNAKIISFCHENCPFVTVEGGCSVGPGSSFVVNSRAYTKYDYEEAEEHWVLVDCAPLIAGQPLEGLTVCAWDWFPDYPNEQSPAVTVKFKGDCVVIVVAFITDSSLPPYSLAKAYGEAKGSAPGNGSMSINDQAIADNDPQTPYPPSANPPTKTGGFLSSVTIPAGTVSWFGIMKAKCDGSLAPQNNADSSANCLSVVIHPAM